MEGMKRVNVLLLLFVGVVCLTVDGCLDISNRYACKKLRDGDYNVCPPACEYGKFITCSNGRASKSSVAGVYTSPLLVDMEHTSDGSLVADVIVGIVEVLSPDWADLFILLAIAWVVLCYFLQENE